LAPEKTAVFREAARVLRPGGRFAVSDIALTQPLPSAIAADVMAYVGCIAGAMLIEDYRRGLQDAGFADVAILKSGSDLNAYSRANETADCCTPPAPFATQGNRQTGHCGCSTAPVQVRESDKIDFDINDYAVSVQVLAVKPRAV
jgi:SAM-dependent methyltransferase